MKKFTLLLLIFAFNTFAAKEGLRVQLPSSWIEVPKKAVPAPNSFIYAPKTKSESSVVHQLVEVKPAFPDLERELRHYCRVYESNPGEFVKAKGLNYCLFKNEKMITVTKSGTKKVLHSFQFNKMNDDEVKKFVKNVSAQ